MRAAGMCHSPFVEVELVPLGLSQLAGTHEDERCKAQSALRHEVSLVAVERTEELPDTLRIDDRGVMLRLGRRQCTTKVSGRIAVGSARGDCITEDLAAAMLHTVSRLHRATAHDPP